MVHVERFIWLLITWKTGSYNGLFSLETVSGTEIHRRTKMFLESRLRGVSSQRKSWGTWAAVCCYHGNTDKPTDAMTLSITKILQYSKHRAAIHCPLYLWDAQIHCLVLAKKKLLKHVCVFTAWLNNESNSDLEKQQSNCSLINLPSTRSWMNWITRSKQEYLIFIIAVWSFTEACGG